ncbi:MAG: hypothetical protein JSU00_25765 [Acidobacteria bacterium]|nr:hypothetical protein [Acidobacteriota bacterium]
MLKNGRRTVDEIAVGQNAVPRAAGGGVGVAPRDGAGPLRRLEISCFDHGFERAVRGGALEARPGDLEALEEFARARAQVEQRLAFDPANIAHDQLREGDYKVRQAELKEAKDAERHANAHLRQCEQHAAQARSRLTVRPQPSFFLLTAAVIVFAITVAPTLHDFVFHTLGDEFAAWFLSLVSGVVSGVLLGWAVLGAVREVGGTPHH